MKWYWRGLKNYANFEGRARRKEYWLFHVFNGIICFILFILSLMVVSLFISGIMTAEGYDRYQVGYIIGYGGGSSDTFSSLFISWLFWCLLWLSMSAGCMIPGEAAGGF